MTVSKSAIAGGQMPLWGRQTRAPHRHHLSARRKFEIL